MSDPNTQKFKVTTSPALPAECSSCGRSADGTLQFLDWGFSLDYYGAVVFCYDCVFEMGTAIGMCPVADRVAVEGSFNELGKELDRVANERDLYRSTLDAIGDLRSYLSDDANGIESSRESNSEVGEAELGSVEPEPIFAE